MDSEKTVIDYLAEFGNTKETDLLNYIKRTLGYSESGSKKLLERLQERGKIFRVVHTKLHPPGVYLSVKEHHPLEIQKESIRAEAQIRSAELNAYAGGERQ